MKLFPLLPFALATITSLAYGYRIDSVKVGGEDKATIAFVVNGELTGAPAPTVRENVIEIALPGGELAESAEGKMDLVSPHALVQRVSVFRADKGLKAKIVLNGTEENLRNRLRVAKDEQGFRMDIAYPANQKETLSLLKEEQEPISSAKPVVKASGSGLGVTHILISLMVILAAGAATYFGMRFLKTKGAWKGSRKFLIEQLGYCPTGPKSGISLIKVGSEFILIGSTPQQISFLSRLPKLEAQYEDEAGFERGVFKDAVAQEVNRMRKPGIEA